MKGLSKGRSDETFAGEDVYSGAKVCQVLLLYAPFAIRHQICVKENWS